MMKRVVGDLIQLALEGRFDVIVHGVNAQCVMGSGIAKSIREAFPEAYEADCKTIKGDREKLGTISFAEVHRNGRRIIVVNACTQFDFQGGGVKVDYEALDRCLTHVRSHFKDLRIGYPKIGAGLARGNWHRIALLIEKAFIGLDHTLVTLEGDLPDVKRRRSYYAGIGSRQTPPDIIAKMERIAARLAIRGLWLRTGGADGADSAFWRGCREVRGPLDLWVPWEGFNGHYGSFFVPTKSHFEAASKLHPAWNRLERGPQALHARNVGQVLGADLSTPVEMVICWTKDCAETGLERSVKTGGTGTAIQLAWECDIPVYNLARPDAMDRLAFHVMNIS